MAKGVPPKLSRNGLITQVSFGVITSGGDSPTPRPQVLSRRTVNRHRQRRCRGWFFTAVLAVWNSLEGTRWVFVSHHCHTGSEKARAWPLSFTAESPESRMLFGVSKRLIRISWVTIVRFSKKKWDGCVYAATEKRPGKTVKRRKRITKPQSALGPRGCELRGASHTRLPLQLTPCSSNPCCSRVGRYSTLGLRLGICVRRAAAAAVHGCDCHLPDAACGSTVNCAHERTPS